ncbi:MAG: hypothetical protein JST16_07820 [Bdellovibrionales bacterium]|nr:hypothetical protein [Bdellovibrionales bacterium]
MRFILTTSLTLALLAGCAQARKGIGAGAQDEIWSSQPLCANSSSATLLACADVTPDITANSAEIAVNQLGFDPAATPYRVFARAHGASTFVMLADNVTTPAGSSFVVKAKGSTYIEEYEEWIIEIAVTFDSDGYQTTAQPLQGTIAARATLNWPELDQTTPTK